MRCFLFLTLLAAACAQEASKPKRRVRPRLARRLADAQDMEVDTPNGPVMAWRLGDGPATLLVHGWEADNALWSPMIDACAEPNTTDTICVRSGIASPACPTRLTPRARRPPLRFIFGRRPS